MFHSTQTCGRCGNLVDFRFDFAADYTARKEDAQNSGLERSPGARTIMKLQQGDEDAWGAALAFCPRCSGPTLITFRTTRRALDNMISSLGESTTLFGGQSVIEVLEVHPKTPQANDDPFWPQEIRRPFADAQMMLVQHMSPSIIIATCRTVLDVATKQLDGTGKSIMARVEDLQAKGTITEAIAAWSHDLRRFGNDATHDASGTEADAREFIEFLKIFLNIAFSLPGSIQVRRQGKAAQ